MNDADRERMRAVDEKRIRAVQPRRDKKTVDGSKRYMRCVGGIHFLMLAACACVPSYPDADRVCTSCCGAVLFGDELP